MNEPDAKTTPTKHDAVVQTIKFIASNKDRFPKTVAEVRPLHTPAFIKELQSLEDQKIANGNFGDLMLVRGLDATTYSKKKLEKVLDLFKTWDKFLKSDSYDLWAQKHKKDPADTRTRDEFVTAGGKALSLLLEDAPDFGGMLRNASKTATKKNAWYQTLWDMDADKLLPFLTHPENSEALYKFQQLSQGMHASKSLFARVQHQLPIALKIANATDQEAMTVLEQIMAIPVVNLPQSKLVGRWEAFVKKMRRKDWDQVRKPMLIKYIRKAKQLGRRLIRPSNNASVGAMDEDGDYDEPMEDPVHDAPTHVPKRARNEMAHILSLGSPLGK